MGSLSKISKLKMCIFQKNKKRDVSKLKNKKPRKEYVVNILVSYGKKNIILFYGMCKKHNLEQQIRMALR